MKEQIRDVLMGAGAIAVGFARAGETDAQVLKTFENWIGEGQHGDMAYLERHLPLKKHTDNVLKGAKTIISLAFDYKPETWRDESLPYIASYAYIEDYHLTLRERLSPIVKELENIFGGKWRICIDSAPVAERYWAIKSGIGKRGLNGAVIIDGCGALNFLAEILSTIEIAPDSPSDSFCDRCGRCIGECPTKALRGDGTMDSRRCINYLTIEKKGEFTEEEKRLINLDNGYLFGCDRCLRVCPHNNKEQINSKYGTTKPDERILSLTAEDILSMSPEEFKKTFGRSPLSYAGYSKLFRNALENT